MKDLSVNLESLRRRTVHPFPARMAANIPWDTLRLRKRRLRVLDPMAGSGTAAIVARATGHKALAYDLDPLAVLIARVGTATVRPDRIITCAQGVLRSAQKLDVK